MIIVTTETVPGKTIKEALGVVRGNSVRAKWFGADIGATLKNIVGGELVAYQRLMTEAREKAMDDMASDAEQLGADAIVGVRFMTAAITQGAAEILVFGTAVKLK